MIDNRIKFRHLQCFIEVVRQGGVVKAADHLSITQPAVSKKLKELEEMLGVALLERSRRGVVLTRYGELFLRHALNSADALREGIDRVTRSGETAHAPVVIGVLPTVAALVMPKAVERFKRRMPDTDIRIITGPNTFLLSLLRVSELDLVVGRLADPDQMQGLVFEQLYLEQIAIVVRPGHPIFDVEDPLKALGQYPIILPPSESIIRPTVEKFLIAHGITANSNRLETVSHAFARSYVRDTDTVWLISRGAVARDIGEGDLTEVLYDARDTMGPVGLTSRVNSAGTDATDQLVEEVRRVASAIYRPA